MQSKIIGRVGLALAGLSLTGFAFDNNHVRLVPASFGASAPALGFVLAHWSNASRAMRYRVFKQIDGVDAIPVNSNNFSDIDVTLTGPPSGKTLTVYGIAANDAGQAAPSDPVSIVVP